MMSDNAIILYPTNWLYNASVMGFLEVIASEEGSNIIESWLKDDGSVEIEKEIFADVKIGNIGVPYSLKYYVEYLTKYENLDEWLDKADKKGIKNKDKFKGITQELGDWGYKYVRAMNKLFASKTPYQNLIQPGDWQNFSFAKFVLSIPTIINKKSSNICGLCLNYCTSAIPNLSKKTEERLKRFSEMHVHSLNLGPSIGEFPNAFWNMTYSFSICPLCAYLLIHSHIPFIRIKDGDVFINHSSFKVMWYLNRFLKSVLGQSNAYQLKQLLGLTLLEFTRKVSVTLGIWSMLNIEMVIKRGDTIDYYSLSSNVVKILLDRVVASLLNDINEPYVFELILNEDFSSILELNHELLKSIFDSSFESNKEKYKYVFYLKDKNNENRRRLLRVLPLLYSRVFEILS